MLLPTIAFQDYIVDKCNIVLLCNAFADVKRPINARMGHIQLHVVCSLKSRGVILKLPKQILGKHPSQTQWQLLRDVLRICSGNLLSFSEAFLNSKLRLTLKKNMRIDLGS